MNAHYFILLKNRRDQHQVEAFGRQIYPRKSHSFSEIYERGTMRPHGYLVVHSGVLRPGLFSSLMRSFTRLLLNSALRHNFMQRVHQNFDYGD